MTTPTLEKSTYSHHGSNLILDVENFGPITKAKSVEIKPMTVFVGPSNTGKSYLAVLLHAFLQAANSYDDPIGYSGVSEFLRHERTLVPFYTSFKHDIARWAIDRDSDNIEKRPYLSSIPIEEMSQETREFIANAVSSTVTVVEKRAYNEIIDYFDLKRDVDSKSRRATYNANTKISMSYDPYKFTLTDLEAHRPSTPMRGTLPIPQRLVDMWSEKEYEGETELNRRDISNIDRILARYIHTQFRIIPRSFYLPTGRTGIMNAHRVLTSQIVKRAHRFGIEQQDNINYHRLARDFLTLLIDLGEQHEETDDRASSHFVSVADLIARSLIEGEINVTVPEFGLPDFEYVRDRIVTPMFRASSMVTELAPIILVLRHYVHRGNVVIIDEPEAHLHPEAQQQMAAALAFMVRSGLRVLITTHSHYMVEQLSAFVNASKLDKPARKRALSLGGALGDEDIYLNEEETAVYGFDRSNSEGGTVVYEIPLGDHREYAPHDHSKAVNRQYNRLQRVLEARERLGV